MQKNSHECKHTVVLRQRNSASRASLIVWLQVAMVTMSHSRELVRTSSCCSPAIKCEEL